MKRHNFYRALLLIAFCGMAFVGCEKEDTEDQRDGMDDERRVSSLSEPPSNQIFYNSTCKLDIQFFESAIQHDYDSVSKYGCVTFASAINEIPAHAFEGDDSITAVALPKSVTTIGDRAFEGCASLYSAMMNGVLTIGVGAFSGSKLYLIDVPEVQTIGDNAFSGCKLESINLPKVQTIGNSAFSGCDLLVINLPEVTTVGNSAFASCKLNTVILGEKIVSIGADAFAASRYSFNINIGISMVVCLSVDCPRYSSTFNPFEGSKPFLMIPKEYDSTYEQWLRLGWVKAILPSL